MMKKHITAMFVAASIVSTTAHAEIIESFGSGANQFSMTFVPIGNPGNVADTTGSPNPAGSVGYHYNMGKYEVSREMIIKANALGNLGITLEDMVDGPFHGPIPSGNGPNRPATGVSWNEAARYVNWLNTSQGYAPAYKFAVQPAQAGYNANANILLWQSTDAGYDAANLFRNTLAHYFLPSTDEWYKAAYYDPNANGGFGGYWNYATGSDTRPIEVAGGTASGTAVYNNGLFSMGPADIDNAGGLSPYGVMGQGGNVFEFQETEIDLVNNTPASLRGNRGGHWFGGFSFLLASVSYATNPLDEEFFVGFRVASVPEPSSAALLMLATVGLWQRRKRSS